MSEADIPERVRLFIFEQIDSAEQLEVLLFLRQHAEKSWTSQAISNELRSTPASVSSRLEALSRGFLLVKEGDAYRYQPQSEELRETIDKLNEIYRIRRQKIFEMIFSPMKKVKHFAEAFMVGKSTKKGDE